MSKMSLAEQLAWQREENERKAKAKANLAASQAEPSKKHEEKPDMSKMSLAEQLAW